MRRRRPADACASAAIANAKTSCGEMAQVRSNAEERARRRRRRPGGAGMEERVRSRGKKLRNSRATAEKALSEVKRSAAQSLKDVQAKTKVALEKAALAAQEREEEAVARTDAWAARREERTLQWTASKLLWRVRRLA